MAKSKAAKQEVVEVVETVEEVATTATMPAELVSESGIRYQVPGAPRKPTGTLSNALVWIYGAPKIGKSTLAAGFPGVWFLATEKGHDWLETREPTLIESWDQFIELCLWIDTERPKTFADGTPIKTLCIDVVDLLFSMCKDSVCKDLNIGDPSELDYGKGWSRVNSEFQRVITKMRRWPYGLVCISHARDREITMRTKKTNKVEPDIGAGGGRIISGLADLIVYCYSESLAEKNDKGELTGVIVEERRMRLHPASNCIAGGRMAKMLPADLPLEYNALLSEFKKNKLA